ncbi:hypothetical protein A9Q99_21640 [Gammaproteobacteria bacterium 45_16_T64]|nr:hypothetical protein A9Q99_21640 [Gammaproteobacteria bacterium 45_16_T64]
MSENFETIGDGDFAISGDYLIALNEYASEYGMTPQQVLKDTAIPLNALIKPNIRIRHRSMDQLVRNIITGLSDPLLPIRYGKRLTISRHGVLGFAAQSSRTLLEASTLLIDFIQTRSGGGERIHFEILNDQALLSFHAEDTSIGSDVALFHVLSVFTSIENIGRLLTGTTHTHVDTEIRVSFDKPCDIPKEILSPGLVLKFNQKSNQLCCPMSYLKTPLASANPALFDEAKKECESELSYLNLTSDITTQVRSIFRGHQGKSPTIDLVAEQMNVSTRTLKRKLHDAGTTYQKIKDSERFTHAIRLLEHTQETMERIAETLGYSDASNFTKAFKNWAEMSPNEYRIRTTKES